MSFGTGGDIRTATGRRYMSLTKKEPSNTPESVKGPMSKLKKPFNVFSPNRRNKGIVRTYCLGKPRLGTADIVNLGAFDQK